MEAVIALNADETGGQLEVLEWIDTFVTQLGAHHNTAKPRIVGSVVTMVNDNAVREVVEQTVEILVTVFGNAEGVADVQERIGRKIDDAAKEVSRADYRNMLSDVRCRARGTCFTENGK